MKPNTLGRLRLTRGSRPAGAAGWRARAPLAALVAGCVGVATLAVTGASQSPPGLDFLTSGHWVYNSELKTAMHVDGGTKQVDGRVTGLDAPPDSPVVQTDTHGYVLGRSGTQEFGKSDLTVQEPAPSAVDEPAVGLEAAGVAYSVRLSAGVVQRFGEHPAVVAVGGPLSRPAYTADGTLWLHRQDTGQLCQLPTYADRVSCPATVATGKRASIVTVGDQPVVVDTTARTMARIDDSGLGRPVPIGDVDLGSSPIVAANDVAGRLAILDPQRREVHLIDTARLLTDQPPAPPQKAKLPPGTYTAVASSGRSVAVLDSGSGMLRTFDSAGTQQDAKQLTRTPRTGAKPVPTPGERPAKLFRGEDSRLYADSATGDHVLVVDTDGEVASVDVGGTTDPSDQRDQKAKKDPPPPPKEPKPKVVPTRPKPVVRPTPPRTIVQPTREPTRRPPAPPKTETAEPPDPEPTREPERRDPTPDPRTTPPPRKPPAPGRLTAPAARKPSPPGSVSATAGSASATVRWGAASGNGSVVTGYVVSWRGGSRTVPAGSRSSTVTGLTNGTSYVFTVRARNAVGLGQGRNSAGVRPVKPGKPGAPSSVRGVASANGRITITWKPPSDGSAVTGYQVSYKQDHVDGDMEEQQGVVNLPAGARRHVITNTYADPYDISVTARNASGTGTIAALKVKSGTAAVATASRGADTTASKCEAPDCAFVKFVMQRFMPHSDYLVTAHSTRWPNYNEGGTWTTDANGRLEKTDEFPFAGVGQEVWIRVHLHNGQYIESNHVVWTDR